MENVDRRWFLTAAAAAVCTVTGCLHASESESESEGEEAARGGADDVEVSSEAPEELPYSTFDVIQADDGSLVAFEMVDHWHFHPIEVEAGESLQVWFRVDLSQFDEAPEVDLDRHDVDVEVVSGDGSAISVEELSGMPGGMAIEGVRAGEVEVAFVVSDETGDEIYTTDPVPVHVNQD